MFTFLTDIFCHIDDFCNSFKERNRRFVLPNPNKKRQKPCRICLAEIMTILVLFHMSDHRTFKYFYLNCVLKDLRPYFPNPVSYQRFVQLTEHALMPLTIFLNGLKGRETGIYYVDSTSIEVCNIKREKRHKVFRGLAAKGRNSMGWFFGLKLHLIINNHGEIMACNLTKANVDDRKPVPNLASGLSGWLFGDKGYLGQEFFVKLKEQFIEIFTKVKKNMKTKTIGVAEKFYLGKRGVIETVIDQLKNCCQIEHTRHRKVENAFVNILSGLIAYAFRERKPSIKISKIPPHNDDSLVYS